MIEKEKIEQSSVTENKAKAEQLKSDQNVQRALKQTAGNKQSPKPKAQTKDKLWLGSHLTALLVLTGLHYLFRLDLKLLAFASVYIPLIQRLIVGSMVIVVVSAVGKIAEIYLIGQIQDGVSRFNLRRILRLILGLVFGFIILSVLFANWYTAVVSLGLISLILGFALQTPITSFIGWVYILIRAPYQVGDRIKIGDSTGDVIDVSYLDTTLWEFGGQYLSTDHPSGRIIKFPNSNILSSAVYNYSWPLFPYIWNEIKFSIAYTSDLEFVAKVMQETAEQDLGKDMMERVAVFRELLAQTPVDQLQVQERPVVVFRTSENTWLEAIIRYLVHPKEAGRVKTRLIKRMLERLNAEPDRVLFPKGDNR